MMTGAFGETHPADDKVRGFVEHHKEDINQKLGADAGALEVIDYKTQVVAGVNYLIHARKADGSQIDIKIFQDLPHNGGHTTVSSVTPHH